MKWLVCVLALLLPAAAMSAQAADRALDATVTIYTADGRERFLGSGIVYGEADRGLTNAHVVKGAEAVVIVTRDGRRLLARVVRRDRLFDLAELRFYEDVADPLQPSPGAEIGDVVYAAGAPLGAGHTLTAGILSHPGRQIDPEQPVLFLQHSAAVNPGSSGGALVDAQGRLLGINTQIADGSRYFVGLAYAVPLHVVTWFLEGGQSAPDVAPGFQLRPLSEAIARALGIEGPGVLVEHVAAASPAGRAGMQPGDVLRAINGVTITKPGDVAFVLREAGRVITVRITRGSDELELSLKLEKEPSALSAKSAQTPDAKRSYTFEQMGLVVDETGKVTATGPHNVGFFMGISVGDTILAVNGVPLADLGANWWRTLQITEPAVVLIRLADGSTRHYVMDPWDPGAGNTLRPSSGANVQDETVVRFD